MREATVPCNSRETKSYPVKRVLLCRGAVLGIGRNLRNSDQRQHLPQSTRRSDARSFGAGAFDQGQLRRLEGHHATHADESPAMLKRL